MHFIGYIQDRRQNPRDDVMTELAHVRHADGELPDVMEIVSHAAVLFGAGQDTTVRLIAAMFRTLDAFRIFDLVYVLTGCGPADSTEVLSTLTYKTMFSTLQFGVGSAMSSAMFATEIVIALGFAVFLSRRMPELGS